MQGVVGGEVGEAATEAPHLVRDHQKRLHVRVLPQRHAFGLDSLAADGGPDQLHVVAEAACENLRDMVPRRMSPTATRRAAAV